MSSTIENSNTSLSYTSRDYESIYNDLTNTIPTLTNLWTSDDENDPGIVLIKLISMLGDMLSYNQDKQSLEVFSETVTQRKNASQVFGLIGYKMHWYRSARCECEFSTLSPSGAVVPRYSKIYTVNNQICYTNLNEIYVVSGNKYGNVIRTATLIEGTPVTPSYSSSLLSEGNTWHENYGYNMYSRDIINNRYYFNDVNIEESSILIIDDSETEDEWRLVDSVDLETSVGKTFEFRIDENDKPYIRLVSYWKNYQISKFKLFYVLSSGEYGEIKENQLKTINSIVASDYDGSNIAKEINIFNYQSTKGYSPETPDEARINSKNYINTINTLITLDDFTRAIRRVNGVSNAIALDSNFDLDSNLSNYVVKAYVIRDSINEDTDENEFESRIKTELQKYKMMPLTVYCDFNNITYYYWTVEGELYLTEPVDVDTAQDLILAINTRLTNYFDPSVIDFNYEPKFIDIIHCIEKTSTLIDYLDTDRIKFYVGTKNEDGEDEIDLDEPLDGSQISGKLCHEEPFKSSEDFEGTDFLYYTIDLETDSRNENGLLSPPIRPKSVSIKINGGSDILIDDGFGKIIDFKGNILQKSGEIDYKTGRIKLTFSEEQVSNLIIDYKKNVVNMAKYFTLDPNKFFINNGSIKN